MSDRIPTGCDAVDDLLGGGFERGAVTQVYGPPAAGKTNLVLSAAVELAARGDSALYLDTEGLSVERMEQLARAKVSDPSDRGPRGPTGGSSSGGSNDGGGGFFDLDDADESGANATESESSANATAPDSVPEEDSRSTGGQRSTDGQRSNGGVVPSGADSGAGESAEATGTDEEVADLASRLILTAAHTFEEQEEAVRDAEQFVDSVELVVLDSATGFYRLERTVQDEGEALRAVGRQLAHLLSLARKHDVAVVFTNQVFTDPDSDRARGLGGHTLDHWSAAIARVERFRGGNRRLTLEKHRSKPAGESARFAITGGGLSSRTG